MKNKIKCVLLAVIIIFSSCMNKKSIDYKEALEYALAYILKNGNLPNAYHEQSLTIITPTAHPLPSLLTVNDKQCTILPPHTNVDEIIKGMNIFQPIPLIEIVSFNSNESLANFEIACRATGHYFNISLSKINGNFKVKYFKPSTL